LTSGSSAIPDLTEIFTRVSSLAELATPSAPIVSFASSTHDQTVLSNVVSGDVSAGANPATTSATSPASAVVSSSTSTSASASASETLAWVNRDRGYRGFFSDSREYRLLTEDSDGEDCVDYGENSSEDGVDDRHNSGSRNVEISQGAVGVSSVDNGSDDGSRSDAFSISRLDPLADILGGMSLNISESERAALAVDFQHELGIGRSGETSSLHDLSKSLLPEMPTVARVPRHTPDPFRLLSMHAAEDRAHSSLARGSSSEISYKKGIKKREDSEETEGKVEKTRRAPRLQSMRAANMRAANMHALSSLARGSSSQISYKKGTKERENSEERKER